MIEDTMFDSDCYAVFVEEEHEKEKRVRDNISRQAAVDALNEYFARIGKLKRRGLTKGEKAISLDTVGALKTLPSAEPKTGKWIRDGYDFPHGNDWIHCSVCGKRGINVPADLTNFCPNCGAKMVREEGEEE